MTRRRIVLLVVLGLLVAGIAQQQAVANDLDNQCGTLCANFCARDGGCRLFRVVGCRCDFVCGSGKLGSFTCGGW